MFIYIWFIFFAVAFTIQAINPTFKLPDDLSKVCLQILGIFFGSYLAILSNLEVSPVLNSFRINTRLEYRFLPFGFVG